MCFNQTFSFGFSALGLFVSWWIYSRTSNIQLAQGVFFFTTMEILQGFQYFVIADDMNSEECNWWINKFLTVLGMAHICLQPYFTHHINQALTQSPEYKKKYDLIKEMCLLGGGLLFLRMCLAPYFTEKPITGYESTEWLRGEKLCTFNGKHHLAWSVPMADPSYYMPSAAIHSFCMLGPFFLLREKRGMLLQGTILWAAGPFLASFITDNLMEQASIWCFFSILQISTMLFLIRETLIVKWSKAGASSASLLKGDASKSNGTANGTANGKAKAH